MAKYYNPTISKNAYRIFNLKAGDMLGSDVGNMIVPVMEVRYINDVIRGYVKNATGTATVWTTPTDKDFYLDAYSISWTSNAANDGVSLLISVTPEGQSAQALFRIQKTTLTAVNQTTNMNLPYPIKLERGSNITVNSAFAAGSESAAVFIYGHYVETITTA